MGRRKRAHRASLDPLEDRLCLSSVGWDGPGRGSASLTYYVGEAPTSLSQAEVNAALKSALGVWSSVADLTFTQTSQPNRRDSLDFTFRTLDGPGGVLARGYFPDDVNSARIAGDVQFDSSERWEVGNRLGGAAIDLVLTAVHEIGHTLGLEHSRAAGSVMADSISPNQTFTGLSASDVRSIQSLYAAADTSTSTGSNPTRPTTPSTPTTTTPFPTRPTQRPRTRFWIPPVWRRWFGTRRPHLGWNPWAGNPGVPA